MSLRTVILFSFATQAFASDRDVAVMDYCWDHGPCAVNEGDCDPSPGQCAAGLTCVEEGAIDHCRANVGCTPGAMDFCWTSQCGPCLDGEGDCDPGQCAAGLTCVEEGSVDHCRAVVVPTGGSNLHVKLNGVWSGVCCNGSTPEVSSATCAWTEYDRTLTDQTAGKKLMCPEGNPASCTCGSAGERMHGYGGAELDASIKLPDGGPIFPDYLTATCVIVDSSGRLKTAWTSPSCHKFRLQ